MSDEFEEIVDNISDSSFWSRILLMFAFALGFYFLLLPLIIVLTIAQALFTLITGQSNANLRYFSASLALYVPQVIEFLTYISDVRPYPFSEFPEVEDNSLQQASKAKTAKKQESKNSNSSANEVGGSVSAVAAEKKPATAKKKVAVKKKVAKKKAVKKKATKKAEPTPKVESEGAKDS